MKRILFTIALSISILISSCNQNLLDINQQGVLQTDEYYANATDDEAEALMASIMKVFSTWHGVYTYIALNVVSDDHYCGGASFSDAGQRYRLLGEYTYTSNTGEIKSIYTYCYQIIYWSNMIVEKLPPNSDTKKRIIAEAKFYRAYCHLFAIRLWGTPPFVDHVLAANEYNTPNGDPAEMWPWIESQFREAAEGLPTKSGLGGQEVIGGRPTKETAYAYLGRALLQQNKYSECAQVLKDNVIETGKYALVPNMAIMNRAAGDFCDEYILESNFTNDDATGAAQGESSCVHTHWRSSYVGIPEDGAPMGWGMPNPSQDFGNFLTEHETKGDGTLSQRYHFQLVDYEGLLSMNYKEGTKKGIHTPPAADNAGWFSARQYFNINDAIAATTAGGTTSFRTHKNRCHMRYAEVLLNYAEAAFQSGDTPGALSALNKVRTRAGLDPYTTLDMDKIKDERRAELYFEAIRFFDLVRWGDAPAKLGTKGTFKHGFYGYQDGTTNIQSRENWKVETLTGNGNGFQTGKHEVFPFPLSEVNNNPNLKQNPGW